MEMANTSRTANSTKQVDSVKCPICETALAEPPSRVGFDNCLFSCPRCGHFKLSGPLIAALPYLLSTDKSAWAKLSHVLRRRFDAGEKGVLTSDAAEAIIAKPLPRPREQADLLLRWIAEHISAPGETISLDSRTHGSIIGSQSVQGFALVLDHLFDSGKLTGSRSRTIGESGAHATLSFDGWELYESLRRGHRVYRKAFIAMKFGDAQLDGIVDRVFKPMSLQAGFELRRIDDVPRAGLIDDRLRVEIQASDFLIADLTHENAGAYWEAGYAEGLGKPVIFTCERTKFESAKTHFDTNHHLTITWSASSPQEAGVRLKETIRATLPHLADLEDATA